ncbi:uncharacterized protein LOC111262535 isoform X3 [Varroa jacobsoni]|nr:uncharacterized protein LOC111262535 isoform X3 [Varroa jacobsoni]XP_022692599.1 uncharacterized protein LOC111262535 isoform X3 [Varroa jacobsoni]
MRADVVQLNFGFRDDGTLRIFRAAIDETIRMAYTLRYCDKSKPRNLQFCGHLNVEQNNHTAISDLWMPSTLYSIELCPRLLIGFKEITRKPLTKGVLRGVRCDRRCFNTVEPAASKRMNLSRYAPFSGRYAELVPLLPNFGNKCPDYPMYPLQIRVEYVTGFGARGHLTFKDARLKKFQLIVPMMGDALPAIQMDGYVRCGRQSRFAIFGKELRSKSEIERDPPSLFVEHLLNAISGSREYRAIVEPSIFRRIRMDQIFTEGKSKDLFLPLVTVAGLTNFDYNWLDIKDYRISKKILLTFKIKVRESTIHSDWEHATFNGTAVFKLTLYFEIVVESNGADSTVKSCKLVSYTHRLEHITGDFEIPNGTTKAAWVSIFHRRKIEAAVDRLSDRLATKLSAVISEALMMMYPSVYLEYFSMRKSKSK